MARRPPLVIGHRGAPGYRPEHSRSSYDLAFALGADAVEPDVVPTADGVLVVRHENEVSGTTDVSARAEFADRRTTKAVDGERLTGWFTEDFTWEEIATLRCRERLPAIRPHSASFDDAQPVLRLRDVLDLVRDAAADTGRELGVVLEVKHASYFAGIGLDPVPLVERELREAGWADGGLPLVIESFESTALTRLRERGIVASFVYLMFAKGTPADAAAGAAGVDSYQDAATPQGLDRLRERVDGVSLDRRIVLAPDRAGRASGPHRVVADAQQRGLRVFAWTCRPENAFLLPQFRRGGGKAARGDYQGEWEILRGCGLDGVFLDHPDLGDFFRDRGPAPGVGGPA